MATVSTKRPRQYEYPTSDGKPMAETEYHRDLMVNLIGTLKNWFARKPRMYVSGNLLMYYEAGNKRKHVSPDVFVVQGVSKRKRLYYLTWEEGRNPAFVIELTSASTRREDKNKKYALYRDVLKVKEYFLFDPFGEYLKPQLQGYSLRDEEYVPIPLVEGRMTSQVLGLRLEPAGRQLRLYEPNAGQWLPTHDERIGQSEKRADLAEERATKAEERITKAEERVIKAEERVNQEKVRAELLNRELARLAKENERQRQLLEKILREKKNGH